MRRTEVIARTLDAVALAEPHLPAGIGFSADWRTNGRSGFNPRGHVNHTTEDARPTAWPNLYRVLRDGHGAISGNAICNSAVRQTARIVVMASGTAWHAGAGSWRGLTGNASVWGTEWQRAQGQTLTPAMLHAGRVWDWALSEAFGWPVANICDHSEWSPGRKADRRGRDGVPMSGAAWRSSIQAPTSPVPPVQEEDIMASIEELRAVVRDVIRQELYGGTRTRLNESVRLDMASVAGAVAAIRREAKLPPSPASDLEHVKRIRNGETTEAGEDYDLREVRTRLEAAARVRAEGGDEAACRRAEGIDVPA